MADTKDTKDTKAEEPKAEDAGGQQAMEKAEAKGDAKAIEAAARTEEAPEPDKDTPDKPVADANPTEVLGPSDSEPNQMSTRGLNPLQTARVEGTPTDGAGGAMFASGHPDEIKADMKARTARQSKRAAAKTAKKDSK